MGSYFRAQEAGWEVEPGCLSAVLSGMLATAPFRGERGRGCPAQTVSARAEPDARRQT